MKPGGDVVLSYATQTGGPRRRIYASLQRFCAVAKGLS
jgi:hypothetical protein